MKICDCLQNFRKGHCHHEGAQSDDAEVRKKPFWGKGKYFWKRVGRRQGKLDTGGLHVGRRRPYLAGTNTTNQQNKKMRRQSTRQTVKIMHEALRQNECAQKVRHQSTRRNMSPCSWPSSFHFRVRSSHHVGLLLFDLCFRRLSPPRWDGIFTLTAQFWIRGARPCEANPQYPPLVSLRPEPHKSSSPPSFEWFHKLYISHRRSGFEYNDLEILSTFELRP